MDYNRRAALKLSGGLASLAVIALVPGCASTSGATTLQMAQTYGDDLIAAVLSAAAVYKASPNANAAQLAILAQVTTDLETAKDALDSATLTVDARGIALQVISAAQTALPIVMPYLGPAGPFMPMALAVLQAFVAALPPPPATPATPPAALHAVAEKYRMSHP